MYLGLFAWAYEAPLKRIRALLGLVLLLWEAVPLSEAGPGLYDPGVTTPGSRSFQRKRSSKSQPAVDDDMFVEHGVFLQVLTVSRKTGQEQPPHSEES